MNALLNKKTLIVGAISSFAITTLYFGLESNERAIDSKRRPATKQAALDPVKAASPAAAKLATRPDRRVDFAADVDSAPVEEMAEGTAIGTGQEESELGQAIASIERELSNNKVIERLNRNEVDASEREMIRESFLELNELRTELLRSKLNEIEAKMRLLEGDDDHA